MAFIIGNNGLVLKNSAGDLPITGLTKNRQRAFYVYDVDEILRRAKLFQQTGFMIHFAMKSNGNPRILRELSKIGIGADVVSLGELKRALQSGIDPQKIIFSGVAKVEEDFALGLSENIYQFNMESFAELQCLTAFAKAQGKVANVALRLNLDIYAPTHPYIQTGQNDNKFGIDVRLLPEILPWLKEQSSVNLKGLAIHVGSQIMDLGVFSTVLEKARPVVEQVNSYGFKLERLDLGGGLGIDYQQDAETDEKRISEYLQLLKKSVPHDLKISLEPGRILVARAGALIGKVLYVKKSLKKNFAILNTGSHHLVRPALYQAFHRVVPLMNDTHRDQVTYDYVGPLCESSDFLALNRLTPEVRAGEWVAILDAGAYGRVMASRYNEHELPAELCVLGSEIVESDL